MPYQLQVPPVVVADDELLERTLDELVAGVDEGTEELLGARLERALLEELGVVPPKWVARRDVALIPLVLLIR